MEQSGEEIALDQQQERLPVNLSKTEHSSDESDNIESGDEHKNGEHKEEYHVEPQKESENHIEQLKTNKTGNMSASDESDYEEPKKMNGNSSHAEDEVKLVETEDSHEVHVEAPTLKADDPEPVEDEDEREAVEKESEEHESEKCDELINSDEVEEKVNDFSASSPSAHVNCAHCDCSIYDDDYKVIDGKPFCKLHCDTTTSPVDTPKEEEIDVGRTEPQEEEKLESDSPKPEVKEIEEVSKEEKMEVKSNGQEKHEEEVKPQVEDILPQSGTAKRLVEQWSNIEALKTSQSAANSVQADSAPKYPPNTAKTIAAKFSAGIIEDQQTPKPRTSLEPSEHLPSQGQARGLIAKFSAMHA